MNGARILAKCGGIDEEGRDEVHTTRTCDVRMLSELCAPPFGSGALAEGTGVTGKGRGKGLSVVLELVGVSGIGGDVVAEGISVIGRTARKDALNAPSAWILSWESVDGSRHIEGEEELEVGTGLLGGSVAS